MANLWPRSRTGGAQLFLYLNPFVHLYSVRCQPTQEGGTHIKLAELQLQLRYRRRWSSRCQLPQLAQFLLSGARATEYVYESMTPSRISIQYEACESTSRRWGNTDSRNSASLGVSCHSVSPRCSSLSACCTAGVVVRRGGTVDASKGSSSTRKRGQWVASAYNAAMPSSSE